MTETAIRFKPTKAYVKSLDRADNRLIELMFYGIEQGIRVKQEGNGLLVPFVITERKGNRQQKKFNARRTDIGLNDGMDFLKTEQDVNFGIIVFDGFLTLDGKRNEAVLVRGFDAAEDLGYLIAQRYVPKRLLSSFKLVGNVAFLGNEEQVLR
jgi:hypothetical protein